MLLPPTARSPVRPPFVLADRPLRLIATRESASLPVQNLARARGRDGPPSRSSSGVPAPPPALDMPLTVGCVSETASAARVKLAVFHDPAEHFRF